MRTQVRPRRGDGELLGEIGRTAGGEHTLAEQVALWSALEFRHSVTRFASGAIRHRREPVAELLVAKAVFSGSGTEKSSVRFGEASLRDVSQLRA